MEPKYFLKLDPQTDKYNLVNDFEKKFGFLTFCEERRAVDDIWSNKMERHVHHLGNMGSVVVHRLPCKDRFKNKNNFESIIDESGTFCGNSFYSFYNGKIFISATEEHRKNLTEYVKKQYLMKKKESECKLL